MQSWRGRPRFVIIAALIFVSIFTLWHTYARPVHYPLSDHSLQKDYIYQGPESEDKVVVLAKTHGEDVSWVMNELPEYATMPQQPSAYGQSTNTHFPFASWQHAIYYMDEPHLGILHPIRNKGREAMAYLSFLIDHYRNLPSTMVFVHAHLQAWPQAWHTDADDYNQVSSIRSLKLDYVQEHGYANMRCIHDPGCPAEIQPFRQEESRTAEHAMRDAWPYMFGGNISSIPKTIAVPCCSQFAVSKSQVLQRSLEDYTRYRQ